MLRSIIPTGGCISGVSRPLQAAELGWRLRRSRLAWERQGCSALHPSLLPPAAPAGLGVPALRSPARRGTRSQQRSCAWSFSFPGFCYKFGTDPV